MKAGTVQQILAELFGQVGLSGAIVEQALGLIAAYIVDQVSTRFTVGIADKDSWLDVKYISVRAVRSYDADAFDGTQQLTLLPGLHIQ